MLKLAVALSSPVAASPACDPDRGDSFENTVTGRKGWLGCLGTTAYSKGSFTPGYDDVLILAGFACINERGHGFRISRAKRRIF